MRTVIDKAGRVVIPAAMRRQAGLAPGTPIDVLLEVDGIRLVRSASRPKLVRVRGRLVARPTARAENRPDLDLARLVEEERDRWPW